MTDVMEMVADANPVNDDDLSPSFETVWRALDHSTPRQRRPMRARRPLMLGSATGTLGAATLAIVLLSTGGAPSAAQAFPILSRPGTDINTIGDVRHALVSWLPSAAALFQALDSAHPFSIPAGSGDTGVGYLLESPDGSSLCLVLREFGAGGQPGAVVHAAFGPVVCASTADAEQTGLVAVGGAAAYQTNGNVFAALVPTGATVDLTANGTTTPVSVTNGIATGIAASEATLSITVAGTTQTTQLGASTQPWWPPTVASGATPSTSAPQSEAPTGGTSTTPTN